MDRSYQELVDKDFEKVFSITLKNENIAVSVSSRDVYSVLYSPERKVFEISATDSMYPQGEVTTVLTIDVSRGLDRPQVKVFSKMPEGYKTRDLTAQFKKYVEMWN